MSETVNPEILPPVDLGSDYDDPKFVRAKTQDLYTLFDLYDKTDLIAAIGVHGSVPYIQISVPNPEKPLEKISVKVYEFNGDSANPSYQFEGHKINPWAIGIPAERIYEGYKILMEQPGFEITKLSKELEQARQEIVPYYLRNLSSLFGLGEYKDENDFAKYHVGDICGQGYEALFTGMDRRGDENIVSAILEKLAKDPTQKLKILELAAGRTFTQVMTSDYGAPWLSRVLRRAFPNQLDIFATDITSDWELDENGARMGIFYVDQDKVINYTSLSTDSTTELEFIKQLLEDHKLREFPIANLKKADGNWVFEPTSSTFVRDLIKLYDDLFPNSPYHPRFSWLQDHYGPTAFSKGQWFIRPQLDLELEASLFDLQIRGNIDVKNLSKSKFLKPKTYDFILARHLHDSYAKPSEITSWQDYLKPDGQILFSGDNPHGVFY